jgi:hypothetical protein
LEDRTRRAHAAKGDELGGEFSSHATLGPRAATDGWRPQSLHSEPAVSIEAMMIDAPETRLIEALKSVDAHGDVAPAHVHDPMTMVLRENAIQANLMRWDDVRGRYVLTGTGRRRISTGSRTPGTVVSFRRRGVIDCAAPPRKPAKAEVKE